MNQRKVKVIEVKNNFIDDVTNELIKKKNVCAYARVSTNEDDQVNSYENQIEEYTKRIKENPEWHFAGMYADLGTSGTQMKKRPRFLAMIQDARDGKIDLIITKSISRFGRNTVQMLSIIRELREKNVTIYFEKENLYSNDPKIDFLLTIMASVAQEESRGTSENIKWSVKKRFKEGRVIINTSSFLGYTKNELGQLVIEPEEAKIVKNIYSLFLCGYSSFDIAKTLTLEGTKNAKGNVRWTSTSVNSILRNEKYCGDALLQKTVTIDYLTHKSVKNDNIETKYYIENNHEPIISKEIHALVQQRLDKLSIKKNAGYLSTKYPLTNLVYCMKCGRPMKRHFHIMYNKEKRVVLDCNHAPTIKTKQRCSQRVIDNDLVLSAVNDSLDELCNNSINNDFILEIISNQITYDDLKLEVSKLTKELELESIAQDELINQKASNPTMDDSQFNILYIQKRDKIKSLNEKISQLNYEISSKVIAEGRIETIKNYIQKKKTFTEGHIFKNFYKGIFVTNTNDLVLVIDNSSVQIGRLEQSVQCYLNEAREIMNKTHFDKQLNNNISYKVVVINEK